MSWGTCDGCGLPKRLKKDGMVVKHRSEAERIWNQRHYLNEVGYCEGSGKPPRPAHTEDICKGCPDCRGPREEKS